MFYFTLKVYFKVFSELFFECCFYFVACTEVDEIIDKESKIDRWLSVNDSARKDARCV